MRSLRIFALICAALAATPAFASEEGGKEGGAKHKVTQSESWVALEPMYATIIDADRPCGMLMVEIGLDIPDEKLRANATAALPLLRDYYLRSLTSFTASTVRPWHQPDVAVIADRLQRVTDRALKKKGAKVLMAQLAMRITK
jgi:flagellar basal body-associated protein FliL